MFWHLRTLQPTIFNRRRLELGTKFGVDEDCEALPELNMRRLLVCAMLLEIGGCNTFLPDSANEQHSLRKHGQNITLQNQFRVSSPIVETKKSVAVYADDLDRCKMRATTMLGDESKDDLAALRHAVQRAPLAATVSVAYHDTDARFARDRYVKRCLIDRGYRVMNP